MTGEMVYRFILLGMLGFYAIEDIRKQTISVEYLWGFAAAGAVLHVYWKDMTVMAMLLGMGVGFGMVLLGLATRESVGLGDGFLLMVTGILLGGAENLELLFMSLLYAAVFSLGVLIFGKRKGRQEIPFVPFLFLGYVTVILS